MTKGDFDVYRQRVDGSREEPLQSGDIDESPEAWLPDGRGLIVSNWQDGSSSLFSLDLAKKQVAPLVIGPFQKETTRVSPDGRWLALVANPSGSWRVHIQRMDGARGLYQIPGSDVHSDTSVRWATRGNKLFFIRRGTLVAVTIDERDGRPFVREQDTIAQVPRDADVAGVSPDGERVLIAKPLVAQSTQRVNGIHVIVR